MRLVGGWLFLVIGCAGDEPATDGAPLPTDGELPPGDDDDDDDTTVVESDTGPTVPDGALSNLSWRLNDVGSLAHVAWTQSFEGTVHVEYSFDGIEWLVSPSRFLAAGDHEQVLIGVPYETDVEWRVVIEETADFVDGETLTTGRLPPNLPVAVVTVSDPKRWLPEGEFLLTSINANDGGWTGGDYWSVILDREGRVVWAKLTPNNHWTLFVQVAVTGDHLLIDEASYWSDFGDGEDGLIVKRWLDEAFEAVEAPGLHHAFVQLADETLVWGSQAHGGGEALVKKAPGQTDETIIWTCTDDFPPAGSGCESNGIFWQESTDTFLYSFYTNSTLVELDHQLGTTLWWAGQEANGYRFDPPQSEFYWQHGVSYTAEGTLLLSSELDDTTTVIEYEVDHEDRVLREVWSNSAGIEAATNGQAWRLANGNTLHMVGSAGVAREIEPGGDDVWRITFNDDHLLGNGHLLSLDQLWGLTKPPVD